MFVDQAISDGLDEPFTSRLDPDEKLRFDERGTILLNSTSTSPKTIIELPTKFYVDYKFDDSSIIKNTTHVDFNDKNLNNVRFVKKTVSQQFENILHQNITSIKPFFKRWMNHNR